MREIKFRAWDVEGKYWYDNIGSWRVKFLNGDPDAGPCIVQQFTGLLDKNGKEIYEGDILQKWDDIDDEPVELFTNVSWNEDGYWHPMNRGASCGCCGDYTDWYDEKCRVVVANIYENADFNK